MSDDYDYTEADALFGPEPERTIPGYPSLTSNDWVDWEMRRKGFRACYRLLRPENVDYAFKELEQRLGEIGPTAVKHTEDYKLNAEAADAIRQQAERISTLQAKIYLVGMDRDKLQSQLSAAQQRLERWEGQPVVGEIVRAGVHCEFMQKVLKIPFGTKLIARLPDDEGEKV